MRKYFILIFIVTGTVISVGLVNHLDIFYKYDNHELSSYGNNEGNSKNTANPSPERDKRRLLSRVDLKQDEEYRENISENPTEDYNIGETIKPWYDDGKPGVSRAELASMHEHQLIMIEKDLNDPDAIVIEAVDGHPAITRAELEALHEEQMRQIQEELNNPDTIIIEETDDQPAVTRRELQALHAEQVKQINEELNDPNTIAVEATNDQPAVTIGELATIHEEQLRQIHLEKNDPDAVAFENSDGTIVTNQELKELHAIQYMQIFRSHFDGDTVLIPHEN